MTPRIVNGSVPARDLRDYIALAKKKPDSVTYASSGNGSVNHLLGEMLKLETGSASCTCRTKASLS